MSLKVHTESKHLRVLVTFFKKKSRARFDLEKAKWQIFAKGGKFVQKTANFHLPDKDFYRVSWVTVRNIDPLSFLTRALECPGART